MAPDFHQLVYLRDYPGSRIGQRPCLELDDIDQPVRQPVFDSDYRLRIYPLRLPRRQVHLRRNIHRLAIRRRSRRPRLQHCRSHER